MEAQANTTREQSNKKSMEVGDPRMGNGVVGKNVFVMHFNYSE